MTINKTMTRAELETAYLLTIPAALRHLSLAGYSDDYLRSRLTVQRRSKRGPRMARHANDEGVS